MIFLVVAVVELKDREDVSDAGLREIIDSIESLEPTNIEIVSHFIHSLVSFRLIGARLS
jgi:hypothetical protein